jgi:tetratricopeptide (TPR) repeat protein
MESFEVLGQQQLQLGVYQTALRSFEQAIELDPLKTEAWQGKAEALKRLSRYEESNAALERAIELQMALLRLYFGFWFNQGNNQLEVEDYTAALASYDQALHHKPDYYEAWNNRGVAQVNLGRYEEAVASYDQALHHKPDYHKAWGNRGVALVSLGQYEEVVASYDQALHHKPDYHEAWNNRGAALEKLGRLEEAVTSLDQALHHKPDYYEAWSNRGSILCRLGQFEAALASHDQAVHYKPDYHEAWNNRSLAICSLAGSQRLSPSLVEALQRHQVTTLSDEPHVAALREALPHLTRCSPGWAEIHLALGQAYFRHSKSKQDVLPYWRDAKRSYLIALPILTATAFPDSYLDLVQGLVQVLLALEETDMAWRHLEPALVLFLQRYDQQRSLQQKREFDLPFA